MTAAGAALLREAARRETVTDGEGYPYLALEDTVSLARALELSRRDLELAALELGIAPERYRGNLDAIGFEGQITLLRAQAGLVGAGGLGGYAVEMLARCGLGALVVIDGDRFAGSNLNRQLYAVESGSRSCKADLAARRVREINGAVEVTVHRCYGDADNLPQLLQGCDLVLDCVDNLPSRFDLEGACQGLGVPLIHGAVAGFRGQVALIRPGRPLFATIYGRRGSQRQDRAPGAPSGTLSFTPALVAARQVAEAVKFLTGLGGAPEEALLLIDLLSGEVERIALTVPGEMADGTGADRTPTVT